MTPNRALLPDFVRKTTATLFESLGISQLRLDNNKLGC